MHISWKPPAIAVLMVGPLAAGLSAGGTQAQPCPAGSVFSPGAVQTSLIAPLDPLFVYQGALASFADFNGDGHDDAVTPLGEFLAFQPTQLRLSTSNGDGTFQPAEQVSTAPLNDYTITDFTRDGLLDILFINDSEWRVLPGNGAGGFGAEFTLNTVHPGFGQETALAPRVADLDGDGSLDLAVSFASGVNRVLIYWANAESKVTNFSVSTSIPGNFPLGLEIADLDADGFPDLISGSGSTSGENNHQILWNNGDRTFQLGTVVDLGTQDSFVTVADLDGDQFPDLVESTRISSFVGSVRVYRNNGDRSFTVTESRSLLLRGGVARVADVDGDNDTDIVGVGLDDVFILRNNGDATFAATEVYELDVQRSSPPGVVDTNNDGSPDLVLFSQLLNPVPGTPLIVHANQCTPPAPCQADLAPPAGVLDLADIQAFVGAFIAMEPAADFDGNAVFDLADLSLFVMSFTAGCP